MPGYSIKTQKLPPRKHAQKVYRNRKPSSQRAGENIASRDIQAS